MRKIIPGRLRRLGALLILPAVMCCWSAGARADDFFRGKVVEIQVGFGPGGGYDLYARTLARFIGRHIPGSPQVIVKNVPGAGSAKLIASVYSVAPRDGTVIGTFDQNNALTSIINPQAAAVDMARLGWIGSMAKATDVCSAWQTSGLETFEDLLRRPS